MKDQQNIPGELIVGLSKYFLTARTICTVKRTNAAAWRMVFNLTFIPVNLGQLKHLFSVLNDTFKISFISLFVIKMKMDK